MAPSCCLYHVLVLSVDPCMCLCVLCLSCMRRANSSSSPVSSAAQPRRSSSNNCSSVDEAHTGQGRELDKALVRANSRSVARHHAIQD